MIWEGSYVLTSHCNFKHVLMSHTWTKPLLILGVYMPIYSPSLRPQLNSTSSWVELCRYKRALSVHPMQCSSLSSAATAAMYVWQIESVVAFSIVIRSPWRHVTSSPARLEIHQVKVTWVVQRARDSDILSTGACRVTWDTMVGYVTLMSANTLLIQHV